MNRRDFLQSSAAGVTAATGSLQAATKPSHPVLFHAGTQQGHTPDLLRAFAAFGLKHICSGEISPRLDEKWSVDGLSRLREQVESFGLNLAMIPLPMSSVTINKNNYPNILLGKSPQRDREIDEINTMIRNAGKAGIPACGRPLLITGPISSAFSSWRTSTERTRLGACDPRAVSPWHVEQFCL